jgi:DNA uptake protein ComE-like DNA-binding protein
MSIKNRLAVACGVAALLLTVAGPVAITVGSTALAQTATVPTPTRLNPNTATEAELKSISLLTPDLIKLIEKGKPYATIGDFNKAISGKLSAEQTSQLYTQLFVPINLNTGTHDDIMLIPGLSQRMSHEFEEYRPYTSMDQFNREIGKYVDATEVARLRSYVTLN